MGLQAVIVVDSTDPNGRTLLPCTAESEPHYILECLLNGGANIDAPVVCTPAWWRKPYITGIAEG